MTRFLQTFLCLSLSSAVFAGSVFAQGVGSRAANQAAANESADDAPPPPEEPSSEEIPATESPAPQQTGVPLSPTSAPQTVGPQTVAPQTVAPQTNAPQTHSDPAANPASTVPPGLNLTAVDPFDELEMVRAAQDRANADREAEEELERARAEESARLAEARRQAERERDMREREATVEQLRRIDERLSRRPEQAGASTPTTIVVDEPSVLAEELESFVQVFGTDRSFSGLMALLFFVLVAASIAVGIRRIRDGLAPKGILPTFFAFIHLAARLLVIALVIAFVVRFLPPRMSLVLLLVFAGVAVAVGWSARDLLPDLIAGIVMAFERRVRRGMWLSSKEFSGQVEHVGFRTSSLRDAQGNELSVPNRFILGAPIATDSTREREQDVTLRLSGPSASALREAIIDAVLSSPWVAPNHRPDVYRDPDEPELWRVRARLLEARFGVRFEGELLERTETILEAILARDAEKRERQRIKRLPKASAQPDEATDKDSA